MPLQVSRAGGGSSPRNKMDEAAHDDTEPTSSNKRPRSAGEGGKDPKVVTRAVKPCGRGAVGASTRASNGKGISAWEASEAAREGQLLDEIKECSQAQCDKEMIARDLYRGVPLTASITDEEAPPQASGAAASAAEVGGRDGQAAERRQLEAKHRLQWARVKQTMMDRLESEVRDLEVGSRRTSIFESACAYLYGQWGRRVGTPRPAKTWLSSEGERRGHVEARAKSLLLKFRHMMDDLARDQKSEAAHLSAAHGSTAVAKGQVPNGFAAVPVLVHVSCPFQVCVTIHGSAGDSSMAA